MLNPEVIELLDDPELGGGVPFVVKRQTRRRSLTADDTVSVEYLRGTGNIQTAQTEDLQLLPDENRSQRVIVLYTTFIFQTGSDSQASHVEPDVVLFNGHAWDVLRVDDWARWGFHIAYATMRREAVTGADAAEMAS